MDKLTRLRQELEETESLLDSPRVKALTRYVLERLKEDLARQVTKLEADLAASDRDNPDHQRKSA